MSFLSFSLAVVAAVETKSLEHNKKLIVERKMYKCYECTYMYFELVCNLNINWTKGTIDLFNQKMLYIDCVTV